MEKKNVLVFPCGSEVGLEIYNSLAGSRFVELYGLSSVPDHGKFVYKNYIENNLWIDDDGFIDSLIGIVKEKKIDCIYPAMDSALVFLKKNEDLLNVKIIGSSLETNNICLSKTKTYKALDGQIKIPKIYRDLKDVEDYPVFGKPDVGYGSRGVSVIHSYEIGYSKIKENPGLIILEYLPGKEYTIDCFSDKNGKLLYCGGRVRQRVRAGISVNTKNVKELQNKFEKIAININKCISLRGAWFYQVKENAEGELVLLEVAARLGGSSSLNRGKGVNFALLSVFDAFNEDVKIFSNDYEIELDRAFNNKYKISLSFDRSYIDLDDCLIIDGKVNLDLIRLIYEFRNDGIEVILLTKHEDNLDNTLSFYALDNLFDHIIHIDKNDEKSKYVEQNSIFIDDSFKERFWVNKRCGVPVFSVDMVEMIGK